MLNRTKRQPQTTPAAQRTRDSEQQAQPVASPWQASRTARTSVRRQPSLYRPSDLLAMQRTVGNRTVTQSLARSAAQAPLVIQRMFGKNIPCQFKTELGSTYDVGEAYVTRASYRKDKVRSKEAKNMYYQSDDVTYDCMKLSSKYNYRVDDSSGLTEIKFYDKYNNKVEEYTLYRYASSGDYPVDMFLDSHGRPEKDDHFHTGDKIVGDVTWT